MSVTSFIVPFGVSLVILCVVERLTLAVISLLYSDGQKDSVRGQLLVGGALNLVVGAANSVVLVVVRCGYLLSWLLLWYLVFYCLSAIWFVLYEQYPSVVDSMFRFYSTRLGPFVHGYLLLPLDLLNLILRGVLPLYNGAVWMLRGLLAKGVLPLMWDNVALLLDLGAFAAAAVGSLVSSLFDYFRALDCTDLSCLERPAVLDLVSPLSSVRGAAVTAARLGLAVCSPLSALFEFGLYPLMDLNFARGVHGLVNGALHVVVQIPQATLKRCQAHGRGGTAFDVLLCTPDLQPAADHLANGLREVGKGVDSWLGVGATLAQRAVGSDSAAQCSRRSMNPSRFRGGLLAGAQTVVGLTDWLMAATNGTLAYFFGHVTTDVAPRSWPEPVDVGLGVAAVSFDEAAEVEVSGLTQGQRPSARQTTALLGCRCIDTSAGLVARCSILPMVGSYSASTHSFDAMFQDSTWSSLMTCAGAEISVRSVRWPVRRYEGKSVPFDSGTLLDFPELDCTSRGSCESVDATIWLVPRCDLLRPEQCSDLAVGTSCYPFCLAARVTGSRNARPVFANADTWRSGTQLLSRDCALGASSEASQSFRVSSGYASTLAFGETSLGAAGGGQALYVSAGGSTACRGASNVLSWVPANSTAPDPRSVPSGVRRRGQPFAIAGDAALIQFPTAGGASTVEVDRLSGNQKDVYSLKPGWAGLPAAPQLLVPISQLTQEERARVVVPLDWVSNRVRATSSRNFVFYAVSPDLQVFKAYLDYCLDSTKLPQAQFMMLSSYSALRVYRVRAYCQETCEAGDLTAQFTFDSFSSGKFTAQSFPQDCGRVYNASIDGLEYVNDQNVAVTVQVADKTYNATARSGANSSYVTYWLNPQTMAVRANDMWPTELAQSPTVGLCAVASGVPHVGSLGAELAVAGLHVFHRVVGAFLYAPGVLSIWRAGGVCPLVSRGHSVLGSCGRSLFDLDDFFDSLDSSSAIFWGIPGWVAEQLEQGKTVDYSPVSDLLRGFGAYGRGAVGITGLRDGGVMSLLNSPVAEQLSGAYALVRNPGVVSGAAKVAGGASSWARFSARFFGVVGAQVAQTLVANGGLGLGDLWQSMVGTMYDQRPFFKSTVTDRAVSSCLGLQVMFGGANPAGLLFYHSCASSALLLDGAFDAFLHLFVDAPVVKCVCRDSEGRVVGKYVRDYCLAKAPQTMQPLLLGMVAASEGVRYGDSLLCPNVIAYARSAMEKSMRPYFASVHSSLDALGSLVDYMLVGFDSDAGRCEDFWQNPQVVVIMPEPVDYFQGCGATTSCKTKCAGPWDAFQSAVAPYDSSRLTSFKNMTRQADSLFFPVVVADMVAPGTVVAITRPWACGSWVCGDDSDDCLAVASVSGETVAVSYFCVPASPAATVYASRVDGLSWEESRGGWNATAVQFIDAGGSSLAALMGQQILYLRRGFEPKTVVHVDAVLSLPLMSMYPLHLIDFMVVRGRLLVNVAVRTASGGNFERSVATIWVDPERVQDVLANDRDRFPAVIQPAMRSVVRGYAAAEFPYPTDKEGLSIFLLWPLTSEGTLRRLTLRWTNTTVQVQSLEPYQSDDSLVARATLVPRSIVLSKTVREDTGTGQLVMFASAGDTYDWLRQLRLTGSGLALTSASWANSQPVPAAISVVTACDGLDCRGCPDLLVRSLCSAYQSCAVFRCIGTPVNLKRPLCGVGGTVKSLGAVGVENVQGAWVMFVDIYMILLQLRVVSNLPGVDVSFPEDAFLGNVCAAKDVSAELISILTATVNSAAQRAQAVGRVLSLVSPLDSNVNTAMSMSSAAVTGFLNQIALLPVYVLSVGHKVMMCQVSGTLAVIGQTGFSINIQPAKFSATDAVAGQCLTRGAEIGAQQTGDARTLSSTGSQVSQMLTYMASGSAVKRLEPFMHMADGALTYLIGVAAKLGDVMQALDIQRCILPDVTLPSTVRCACGDKPLQIAAARRKEGVQEFAMWCSGTISLVDGGNHLQVVWNPYSYEQLQAIVGSRLDAYLEAASRDPLAQVPNDPVFAAQGVSMFAVLTRCRQNYVNKQWDPAAFARFDAGVMLREVKGGASFSVGDPAAGGGVGKCLLDSVRDGVENGACLEDFLMARGYSDAYWAYSAGAESLPGNLLDACLVFSGPASNLSVPLPRRKVFQDCLGGYGPSQACDLSGFVWSPASSNAVPVAERHVVAVGTGDGLQDAYSQRMRTASELVMAELNKLQGYDNKELEVAVFSAEGDVIHQLMDCVFLGPYARMDYWPVPRCDESAQDDCLVGPYWSRDAGRGKSRSLDLDSCQPSDELPFTCGSPTRRGMVKDFVEQYLKYGQDGADTVRGMIREWLTNQTALWYNPDKFGCNSSGGCALGSYLPRDLSSISLQISTKQLVSSLRDRMRLFYRSATRVSEPWISFLASGEKAKYNWSTSAGAHNVEPLAAFHPAKPTLYYGAQEAASPPTELNSYSLWHTCHSALKQVMFTIPVADDGSIRGEFPDFSGGGLGNIVAAVSKITEMARRSSPLFRHYQPRHHPSQSRVCRSQDSAVASAKGSVRFSDFVVGGQLLFNGSQVPPIPLLGFDAGALGKNVTKTFMGLSDHLGFMDRDATEQWLRGQLDLTTSSDFLLRYGAGGLKAGNLPRQSEPDLGLPANFSAGLDAVFAQFMAESDRAYALERARLDGCDEHARALAEPPDLLREFVDGLFPMAQGVEESGVGSYCLRFSVELSMLQAMESVQTFDLKALVAQKEAVQSWRAKCGTQVQLVGMCSALDLYHDGGAQPWSCLQSWQLLRNVTSAGEDMYVTPDCLVKIGDFFYDPCQCNPQWCEVSNVTWWIKRADLENGACKLRFDPRTVVQAAELAWWAEDDPSDQARAWNAWRSDALNLLDLEKLEDALLSDGRSAGNVPNGGQHWASASGYLSDTGQFCDMVADYWPEDAAFPLGYHVTTPCHQDDAGYRTFDNVFVLDRDSAGLPVMRYFEDQSRDADLVDSNFGAGGLCRSTNFGFDMFETNTMRVCTKVSDGEDFTDIHVPRGGNSTERLGLPRCSSTSRELPWGDYTLYDYYDPVFYSVGTVPNLPAQDAQFYPSMTDRLLYVGPQHDMSRSGWGDSCQDFSIPSCFETGRECAAGYKCMPPGVCMDSSVGCLRHSDCPSPKMCTGLGVCEVPKVSVDNQQDANVSFRAHAPTCAGQSFSMRGGSHWGYVPDLLETHGMCSYRHWQEYLYTTEKCCQADSSQVCNVDAGACPYYVFSKQVVNNKWWNSTDEAPSRLRMLPTTCDRDYERFKLGGQEMKSCVPFPSSTWQLNSDGTFQQSLQRDSFWRVYDDERRFVPLLRMPFITDKSTGFLSGNAYSNIKSCKQVQQCFVDDFTVNGVVKMIPGAVNKANRTLLSGALYNPDDQFKCGVIGYYDATKSVCVLDQKLFPLYYFICGAGRDSSPGVYAACSGSIKSGALPSMCADVLESYNPEYALISDVNVPALQALFKIFQRPETLEQHLAFVECTSTLYSAISQKPFDSRGLYFPFAFTMLEFPFSWFYQCMVGSSVEVANSFDKKLYRCIFFESKAQNTLEGYLQSANSRYTDFKSYIFNVRGGYTRSSVTAQVQSQLNISQKSWDAAVERVRTRLFGSTPGVDWTYPRCYRDLYWDLPNDNSIKRKLIEAFVRGTCSDDLINKYVAKLNNEYAMTGQNKTVDSVSVIKELTLQKNSVDQLQAGGVVKKLLTGFVKDFGARQLQAASELSKLNTSVTPIRFEYSMPDVSAPAYTISRESWKYTGMLPNAADVTQVSNIQNCKQTEFKKVYEGHSEEDTDLLAGFNTMVETCPKYAEGYFSCYYESYETVGAVGMSGGDFDLLTKYDAYVDALYLAVKAEYDMAMSGYALQKSVGPITMQPLTFYTGEPVGFSSFKFDLTRVASYVNNINPDVRTPVMCVAGNQNFDFNNCTDANYLALRQHALSRYRRDGGVVVPARAQMDWSVSQDMMSGGAIFSFAHLDRDTRKQYLNQLLDTNSVCGSDAANTYDRLCLFKSTGSLSSGNVINPWMSGWWNPYDQCDVSQMDAQNGNTELIDSLCYSVDPCKYGSTDYFSSQYHTQMPNKDTCTSKNNQKTINLNVNPSLLYNLCRIPLSEDTICKHAQGMLGGTDGYPSEDNAVGGNLYALHEFSGFPDGDGSMFGNVLLAGGRSTYGFLRASRDHIGGHHIGMQIVDSVMLVKKMPLQSVMDKTRIDDWLSDPVSDWVPRWKAGMQADHDQYLRMSRAVDGFLPVDERGKTKFGWDCPLRRRAFYTGGVQAFRPMLPSARRSLAVFRNLTGGLFAHPTQVRMEAGKLFGGYLSTNGFCFCPVVEEVWPGMCTVKTSLTVEHNCSLYSTLQPLRGASWGWSHTFKPRNVRNDYKVCSTQLDWPLLSGALRDGGSVLYDDALKARWYGASDVEKQRCHVLDRVPDFAYVYVSRREMRKAGFDTLRRGVCHTGRAQLKLDSSKRCVRVAKDSASSTLLCSDNARSTVARPASASAAAGAKFARFYRRRCSKCTPPPRFETRGGFSMQAESSFGVPYRRSAERVISQELRAALCNGTAQCSAFLNASAWRTGEFMAALLKRPRSLFSSSAQLKASNVSLEFSKSIQTAPDDSALWARKWVHCPTKDALRTGVGCNGTITKSAWRKDKVGTCHSSILDSLKGQRDPFSQTDICNIDSRLGALCQAIREAQSLVASANCLKSGDPKCSLQEYVYNPSTWESTNQAFVHQTVSDFYKRVDGCANSSDCVCGVDPALASVRQSNAYLLRECAAVPVMDFRDVLIQLRLLVLPICKMLGSLIDVFFNLVLTISSSTRDAATSRALLAWASFKQESSTVSSKFSDMVFDLVFSSGTLGPWLKKKLTMACNVVNGGYMYFADFWCNFITLKMPYFLGALRSIGGWMDVGFTTLNDIVSVILNNYLPSALMDLYQYGYKEEFQKQKYKEKTKAYEDRQQAGVVNKAQADPLENNVKRAESRVDNKVMQALGEGRKQSMPRTVIAASANMIGAIPGPLGIIAGIVNAGIEAYQMVSTIETALKIKSMLDKFPRSWTLYDYDGFYDAIDKMAEFLNVNWECFEVDKEVPPLQCTDLNFTSPSKTDVGFMAPRPTACWAEAQQGQLGVSNLYSCSATSTCCLDALHCEDSRLCADCPAPPVGARRYGCNTMIQRCQCGVQALEVDRCSAQRDCGPSVSCSLLTGMDDVSFGSLASCTQCPTSPICLLGSSQQFGQCTCLSNAEVKVELCSEARGTVVNPDPARLCGVAKDSGSFFSWNELSLVRCVQAVRPVCADVVAEDGNVIRMPVSTSTRPVQVAYSSRRLLSMDDSLERVQLPSVFLPDDPADDVTPEVIHRVVWGAEWNHTAAPCSTLAYAYRSGKVLGPLEESALHSCVYWRTVARQLIRENNLASLELHDTFLLSAGDFSSSLGQRGVLFELLRNPQVLLYALMYSELFKPVRAALVASHDPNVTALVLSWKHRLFRGGHRRSNSSGVATEHNRAARDYKARNVTTFNATRAPPKAARRGRKLLQVDYDSAHLQAMQLPFYSQMRDGLVNFSLPMKGSEVQWGSDNFAWGNWGLDACPLAGLTVSNLMFVAGLLKAYYKHLPEEIREASRRNSTGFSNALPTFKAPNAALNNISKIAAWDRPLVLQYTLDAVGVNMDDVASFLRDPCPKASCRESNRLTAYSMVETLTFCQLEDVMFCSPYRRDLFASAVVMVVFYILVAWLCGYLGLYGVATALWLALPLLIVWYSTGVSVRCFPLIPTCLMDDVVRTVKSLLPMSISFPPRLVQAGGGYASCSNLSFTRWEDPLAFIACDMGLCGEAEDVWVLQVSQWKLGQMRRASAGKDADAYRLCATVTLTYAVPVVFIAFAALSFGSAAVISAVQLTAPTIDLVWRAFMFSHGGNNEKT